MLVDMVRLCGRRLGGEALGIASELPRKRFLDEVIDEGIFAEPGLIAVGV